MKKLNEWLKKVTAQFFAWIRHNLIDKLSFSNLLYIIAGLFIAAIFAVAIRDGWEKICVLPVIAACVAKIFLEIWLFDGGDNERYSPDWLKFLPAVIAGAVINILAIL